jgi:membrane protein
VPPKSIGIVRSVLKDVITPHKGVYFSVGFVGTIWAASNGVSASIEALNMAYGVDENRPFWKTRLLAIGLVFLIGVLLLTALSVLMVGPKFGQWLAARVDLSHLFVLLWPSIHWIIAVGFTVLGIEALYLLAPNGKRQFRATLPGAAFAVGAWLGLSSLLGVYFRHFQTFDKTYGALGGVIAPSLYVLANADLPAFSVASPGLHIEVWSQVFEWFSPCDVSRRRFGCGSCTCAAWDRLLWGSQIIR